MWKRKLIKGTGIIMYLFIIYLVLRFSFGSFKEFNTSMDMIRSTAIYLRSFSDVVADIYIFLMRDCGLGLFREEGILIPFIILYFIFFNYINRKQ